MKLYFFIFFVCNLCLLGNVCAQKKKGEVLKSKKDPAIIKEKDTIRYQKLPQDTSTYEKGETIELLSGATYSEGFGVDSIVKVVGRNITFKQGNKFIFCDSAYFYPKKNTVTAMGNVQISDSGEEGLVISSKKMDYDGNSGTLAARGDANFTKGQTNVRAPAIDYNTNSKIMYYFGNGTLNDGQNQLKSESGAYDTGMKRLFARKNVKATGVSSDGSAYAIESDTLQYSDFSKEMSWKGKKAKITSDGSTVYSENGMFNTKTKKSVLKGKSSMENQDFILKGDDIVNDQVTGSGHIKGNAEIFSKKDNMFINADEVKFNGSRGLNKFYGGRAYMRVIDEKNDTLWVVADTLISVGFKFGEKANQEQRVKKTPADSLKAAKEPKFLLAYYNVKIYKSDLQGVCDSLSYNLRDSLVHFYRQPVLWSEGNQVSGDSLHLINKNKKPHKLVVRENSFVISKDSMGNFNQIKGKYIDAYLKDGKIDNIWCTGNNECVFFQLDDKSRRISSMNKIVCGSTKAEFELGKELATLKFYDEVAWDVIPLHEIEEGSKRLIGFKWQQEDRPIRKTLLNAPQPRKKQASPVSGKTPTPIAEGEQPLRRRENKGNAVEREKSELKFGTNTKSEK